MITLVLLVAGSLWVGCAIATPYQIPRILYAVAAVLLFAAALMSASPADAGEPEIKERCEWRLTPMTYIDCTTAGYAWVIIGTAGADQLVGYLNDDIIHSGKGADYVNGGAGYDVCYVQPTDKVLKCEEER